LSQDHMLCINKNLAHNRALSNLDICVGKIEHITQSSPTKDTTCSMGGTL
jgi:hypothetical protein